MEVGKGVQMGKEDTRRRYVAIIVMIVSFVLLAGMLPSRLSMDSYAQDGSRTVTFRQGVAGYLGCADTRISEERPDTNLGNGELIIGMKGRVAALIRFDVSSIPSNAIVQEATLGLFAFNYGQRVGPIVAAAYQVIRPWKELEATWYKATNADRWGLPGCNDTYTDRSPTALDSATIYERELWYTWDVTSAAQDWVRDAASNKGVVVKQTNLNVGGEFDLCHSEADGTECRPYLTVKYTLVPPTPTRSPTPAGPPTPAPLPCVGTPEPGAILLVLQQGADYQGAEDTWLNFDDRSTRQANEWFMRVGYKQHFSGLIKYDVSLVPRGSRIVCAALSIFAERWSGGTLDVGSHVVKRQNSVPDATWTWATSLMPWQMGGCNGPDDRLQAPESTVRVHTIYHWYDLDLTRAVDGWVNGWLDNNGVSLQAVDQFDTDTVWFTASEDAEVTIRPKLVILYVPPAGFEPTQTPTATCTATVTATSIPSATPTSTTTKTATPVPTATSTDGPTQPSLLTTSRTFQQGADGYAGCADARISAESPTGHFVGSELKVGARGEIASLLRFDLSSIPRQAAITSAQLQLYAYHTEGPADLSLGAYGVRRPWTEEGATWNEASMSVPWGMPGCGHTFSDRAGEPTDRMRAFSTGWYTWSVTGDVQRMVSDPGTNAGWLIRQTDDGPGVISFYASEGDRVGYRPRLLVEYASPR
jgi:hypothetical protein